MSNADGRLLVAVATTGGIAGSIACSSLLHAAASRADAASLVAVTLVWGMFTVGIGTRCRWVSVPALVIAALLVRLPLIGTPPLLSDDLFRYVFEGIALNQGHNPFLESPASLEGVADELRVQVNHPTVTTIYPPLALLWFRFLGTLGGVWTTQLATSLVDVLTPLALLAATRRAWPSWVYALHPLPALEASVGAHIDVLAVALTAWGVAAWRNEAFGGAWWGLVAGAATKLMPAVVLPVVFLGLPRGRWRVLALTAVVLLLLALPILDAGPALLHGFTRYANHWSFNGLVYTWVSDLPGSRMALVGLGAMVSVGALTRYRDPGELLAVVGAAFVLLSPTVHPWYTLWALVPALLCSRWGWAAATVPMLNSYAALHALDPATGTWGPTDWVWWATWPPALLLLFTAHTWPDVSTPVERGD